MASLNKTLDKLMLTEYAAEVMVYFERHKLLEIVTRISGEIVLVRPENPRRWIGENIERIAHEIYSNCIETSYQGICKPNFFILPGRFLYRISIYGRPGSGRRTFASYLVKRFNLVLLDAERIIFEKLRDKDNLGKDLQKAFEDDDLLAKSIAMGKIIYRRLLQLDTLHQGWVLVNYPRTVFEFKDMLEHFLIPPNKLVYLMCDEKLAYRRCVGKPDLGAPQDNYPYIKQMMLHFNEHELENAEYLNHRHETLYVDATCCYETVKTNLLAQLERVPYVMGYKP